MNPKPERAVEANVPADLRKSPHGCTDGKGSVERSYANRAQGDTSTLHRERLHETCGRKALPVSTNRCERWN
jgi:hypothetical protein